MSRIFQPGRKYICRSACDSGCLWWFTVQSRTDKTVTLLDSAGGVTRRGVIVRDDVETCLPLGRYSMAPVLSADKAVL